MAYTREDFIKKYGAFIIRETKGTGILPGTLISQAILESSGIVDGKSLVGASELSEKANNYFGIKAGSSWKGKTYNAKTQEYGKGGFHYEKADFRAYNSVRDSIKDYVKVVSKNKRYQDSGVLKAKTVKEQAQKIKQSGYATDPNYATKVNNIYLSVDKYIQEAYKRYKTLRNTAITGSVMLYLSVVIAGVVVYKRFALKK